MNNKITREKIIDEMDKQLGATRTGEVIRLKELGGLDIFGIGDSQGEEIFPKLFPFTVVNKNTLTQEEQKKNQRESMKFSLWNIYKESFFAYIYGFENICILGCRAVAERVLRILYQDETNRLAGKKWSLGPLLKNCKEIGIELPIINLARTVKKEGDNLSHAKYEVKNDWDGLIMKNTKLNPTGPPTAHYSTGNAKEALIATRDLMKLVFGTSIKK